MTAASDKDPVSKTDATTGGIVDTIKRRRASGSATQREMDLEQAEAQSDETASEEESSSGEDGLKREDWTGIDT